LILFTFTALSRAQRNVANSLSNFKFECIGGSQTDDEIVIGNYIIYYTLQHICLSRKSILLNHFEHFNLI